MRRLKVGKKLKIEKKVALIKNKLTEFSLKKLFMRRLKVGKN